MRHPLHDYSAGAGYFVTFAVQDRLPVLGSIADSRCVLSWRGEIVMDVWRTLTQYYAYLIADCVQVMPDHVHCIVAVSYSGGEGSGRFVVKPLSRLIQAFKAITARRINRRDERAGRRFWQRGFHDRVIRNDRELSKFRFYIETNALRDYLRSRE